MLALGFDGRALTHENTYGQKRISDKRSVVLIGHCVKKCSSAKRSAELSPDDARRPLEMYLAPGGDLATSNGESSSERSGSRSQLVGNDASMLGVASTKYQRIINVSTMCRVAIPGQTANAPSENSRRARRLAPRFRIRNPADQHRMRLAMARAAKARGALARIFQSLDAVSKLLYHVACFAVLGVHSIRSMLHGSRATTTPVSEMLATSPSPFLAVRSRARRNPHVDYRVVHHRGDRRLSARDERVRTNHLFFHPTALNIETNEGD